MAKTFAHIYGQLDQLGGNLQEDLTELLDLGLVCDGGVGFSQAEKCRDVLLRLQKAGGIVAPCLYPVNADPECLDPNWWAYSYEECLRLLKIGMDRFEKIGLGRPFAINTYTPGNDFIRACRTLGIRYLFGFCAPTVGEDGGWKIAQYGSPLSPFFVGEEDFRKPENPGDRKDPMMIVNMELRNPLVCLRHWNEGPWCPLNAQAADRWLEPADTPWPFEAIVEDWIKESGTGDYDNMFHLNLQYFFAGACRDHNKEALKFLSRLLKAGKIENGSVQTWAARMKANGGFKEQNTVWSGELPGFHVGHRPGYFPDVVVSENLKRQSVWQYPDAKPERYYDYTRVWKCNPFQPDGSDPKSDDFSAFDVKFETVSDQGSARTIRLTVKNNGPAKDVPFLSFDSFAGLEAPFSARGAKCLRVLPHPSGSGAALMAEQLWQQGETIVDIQISGRVSTKPAGVKRFGALLEAHTFAPEGHLFTALCSQTPERFFVKVKVNADAQLESLLGIHWRKPEPVKAGTVLELEFNGGLLAQYHRFWGLRAGELEVLNYQEIERELQEKTRALVDRVAPGLNVPAPGYQLFGNIRMKDRWDRVLARKAGEAERIRINDTFRTLHPEAGEFLVEAHPGLFLPRGSITKVLGHEFDFIECKAPFIFKERCADYPQGWDWGVGGWVQWRHLHFLLKGLDKSRKYNLHFHAVDAESRDYVQKIVLSDERCKVHVEIPRLWQLPKGVESRFSREAFFTVPLPAECLAWTGMDVHVAIPGENIHPYNWIKEQEAPGVLYHFWLTECRHIENTNHDRSIIMKRIVVPCLMSALFGVSLWGAAAQNMIGRQTQNEGVFVVPAKQAVKIDGDLKEWDLSGQIWSFMDTSIRDSFSVKTAAMWDADNLYLSFTWRDPMPLNSRINPKFKPSKGWMADAEQFRVVAGDEVAWITCWAYNGNISAVTIDRWKDVNNCRKGCTNELYYSQKPGEAKIGNGIESAYKKAADGKGFIHEIKFPWKVLFNKEKKMAAGEKIRMGMEFMWGSINSGWPMHRYADNMQPGVTTREFFWSAKNAWGNLTLVSEPVKTPRKYISGEAKLEGTMSVRATVPADAKTFTIVIEDKNGTRIRNLAGEFPVDEYTVKKEGKNAIVEVKWDCLDDMGNLVPAGNYKVRGLTQNGITAYYESCFFNPGTPAWDTADGTGAWGADHCPIQFVTRSGKDMIFCSLLAEGGSGTFAVGPDFRKRWHETNGTLVLAANDRYTFTVPYNSYSDYSIGALLRLDQKTGKFSPFVKNGKPTEMPFPFGAMLGISKFKNEEGKEVYPKPLAIGATNETVVLLLGDGMMYVIDANTGDLKKKEPLTVQSFDQPGYNPASVITTNPFAFDGKVLYFFRSSQLIRRDLASAKETVVKLDKPVEKPSSLSLDLNGNIYIADLGKDLQVKKYAPNGKQLQTFGKKGGRVRFGKMEKDGMRYMSSCAVDAKGNVWVVECSKRPRRISVWAPNGKFLRDFIGNCGYAGTGTTIHDSDPNRAYAEGNELVRSGKRTWEVTNVMYDNEPPKDSFFATANIVSSSQNEHTFFSSVSGRKHEYNVSSGDLRCVGFRVAMRMPDGNWKTCAAITRISTIQKLLGGMHRAQLVKPCYGIFKDNDPADVVFWTDLNGDGFIQKNECEIIPAAIKSDLSKKRNGFAPVPLTGIGWGQQINHVDFAFYTSQPSDVKDRKGNLILARGLYQFKPVRFLPNGVPVYSSKGMKKVLDRYCEETVPVDGTTRTINFLPIGKKPFVASIDIKTGKLLWQYPDFYHNVHGSHNATMPKPGMIIGSLRIMGIVPVKSGRVFSIRGNLGQDYFMTEDGLFVSSLFNDCRLPTLPLPSKEEDLLSVPMNIYSGGGEHFTGVMTKHDDGVIRMNCGLARQAGMIMRVEGLDSIRRFNAPDITVSNADLVNADKDNTARASALAKPQTSYIVEKASTDKKGNVQLKSKVFRIEREGLGDFCNFRAGYDANNLYLQYNVSESSPWINTGKDWKYLFKTGDCVDFQFSLSGNRKRKCVEGDVRLLIAPYQGKNAVVMYRPVAKNAQPSEKCQFTSPVQTVFFDQAKLISDVKVDVKKAGNGYNAFVTIPWKVLGVKPAAGLTLRCDAGFILSDALGQVNMARIYRTNRHTNLVNDLPGEAILQPDFWGEFILGK